MEDNSIAQGGAYTYKLIYTNPMNEVTTLYESERVGGENTTGGLREATNALEDFFFLDTLKSGQRGRVILQIGLDGETLGNSYQDTLADLQMNFAVGELRPDHTVAANIVKDQMGALLEKSNVKRSDKDVVESVRAPYENLTGDQKMKVKDSTLKKLIDAEEILENQNINGVNSHNGETDSKKLEKESVSSDYYNSMDSLPCISGVEEGTGGVITVQLEDSKPGYILIAAIYDINGQFLDLQEVTLTDNEESHTFDFTGTEYDHAKALLLDEDWRPVCENAVVNTSKAEKGDLEIIMNLTGYEDSEPASFVFKVTACDKNNNVVYSNVSLLNFTEPGQKFILLKNLPVGSKVTVKEYCIGHYTADTASEVTPDSVISASEVLLAEFTGSYNSYCKGGHGILNEFVYGKQNGSSKENTWNWLNPTEKAAQ